MAFIYLYPFTLSYTLTCPTFVAEIFYFGVRTSWNLGEENSFLSLNSMNTTLRAAELIRSLNMLRSTQHN